jgi:hypothetical protein
MTCKMNGSNRWRRMIMATMLGLCYLCAVAGPLPQSGPEDTTATSLPSVLSHIAGPSPQREPEDNTRRIWNKMFREARGRDGARRPKGTTVKGELVGITIWRLRGDQDTPTAERAAADTLFNEGERLRLSIEAPRRGDSYLYVIDREVYADGSTSDPYLIYPSPTTPEGGNVVTAGKPVFIPARGDEYPYFTLERARKDQLREEIAIIVCPRPLKLQLGTPDQPIKLEKAQVAQWERQWGGHAECREERDGAGSQWTAAEREADKGERRLVQGDPLPQTIYRIKVRPEAPMMLRVSLRIAP